MMPVMSVDWQKLIDLLWKEQFAEAASMASSGAASAAKDTWLALELDLVAAFANLRQHDLATAMERLQRAGSELESWSPLSPVQACSEFVRAADQAGVLACCIGDLSLGEHLFARAGEEIDRLFRAYPIDALMRNAYHRALAMVLGDRRDDAAPHIALCSLDR